MEISLEFLLCPPHGNTGFVSPTYRNIHFIYEEIMPQLYIWFSVIETGIMGFSIFLMGIFYPLFFWLKYASLLLIHGSYGSECTADSWVCKSI